MNQKLFINPWNLTRVSRDYPVKMDQFDVEMIHLEVNLSQGINATRVPIPHKSFVETFIPEFINILDFKKKEQFEFFNNIKIDELIEETDISDSDLIAKIAKDNNISEEAINIAIDYLGEG
jgi:hypothetical protein